MSSIKMKLLAKAKRIPGVGSILNRWVTNSLASSTSARPHSFSLWRPNKKLGSAPSDYLSWHSVTDKVFFDRHLGTASGEYLGRLPPNEPSDEFPFGEVTALFERRSGMQEGRSSVLFMFFAQWFTDGFFRSSHLDPSQTSSNHNIDLAQIYGADEDVTNILRSGSGGKLRSQKVKGAEYPDYLGEVDSSGEWQVKQCYQMLPYVRDKQWFDSIFKGVSPEQRVHLFATGLERGNLIVGHMAISTLFLREHNNICDQLAKINPDWDDDRLFHTARIINNVILMKIVIEVYVNHIAGVDILKLDPSFVEKQRWYREPWIAAEFNLLYRWHGLVPDSFIVNGEDEKLVSNFGLLTKAGLSQILSASSAQAAGKISLDNVPSFLMPEERKMIEKGREWKMRSFNDYREHFGLSRITSFTQLCKNEVITQKLQQLYKNVDDLEFTVGLFAEEDERTLTGELQTAMVAYDAITQIYTNPLLACENYNEKHFTKFGMDRINSTRSFQDLVDRNVDSKITVTFKNNK